MSLISKFTLTLAVSSICASIASAQTNLIAETAAPTGVPGTSVLTLAEVASLEGVADLQVRTGQTLTNSLQNLAEGNIDIAAVPSLLPFLMSRGAGPYAALGPENGAELADNVAMLYTYRLSVYALSAYDSSDFDGWDSVEGATIFNGPPRGAALTKGRGLITLATGFNEGEGYTGVQTNWGQAVSTIAGGGSDAQVLPMSTPDARVGQISASGDVTVFSFPKDIFEGESGQRYGSAPGVVALELPIEDGLFGPNISVASEDGFFRGYGDVGGDAVNVDMDEELAYQLTRAFIENIDVYHSKGIFMANAWLGETDPERSGMCGPSPVRYHPGAVRAWEEAGFTIPDCAKP
ncbi:hypothetical protein SAMN05444287_1571 [Octadecabacter temperatus]|uniref:Uncharacterized protein n=1 Tax=Octadecabacter temperatus TaxID=1458307 RepID=A0A0K0Y6B4_9RHOB|nr:C4-dicarboxylate ABC transporter substrate-binding protein [Octadecabacter temperatus]AKS46455.1 hypothetical protein OSB_19150 [Octadecabacter temperatus]SIO14373.1 hypothetical protein SAMN05444287_1571 [Octadecabacter temperatus]